MNNPPTKLKLADLKQRHDILKDGLQDFLDDNDLYLSKQNFERTFQHLLASMAHYKDLTLYDVTNYLQQILEHHEYVIDTMNKTGLAEESLIKLIITAENDGQKEQGRKTDVLERNKRWKFSLKALPLPLAVSLVLLLGFAVAKPLVSPPLYSASLKTQDVHNEIGASSINELKDLVKKVVELEGLHGNETSTAKIWNQIKVLDAITQYGYKASYKNFSPTQYREAKIFLESRINALEVSEN